MSGVLSHHLHLHLHSVVVFFPVAAVVVFVVAAVAILVVDENEGNKLVQYALTIMIGISMGKKHLHRRHSWQQCAKCIYFVTAIVRKEFTLNRQQ